MNDDYLWDGSGEPDAEVQKLEALLGRYRSAAPMPDFKRVVVMRRRPRLAARRRCRVDRLRDPRRRCVSTRRANRWRATEASGVADVPAFDPAHRRRRAHGTRIGAPAIARRRHDRPRREYDRPPHRESQQTPSPRARRGNDPREDDVAARRLRHRYSESARHRPRLRIHADDRAERRGRAARDRRMGRPHARLRTVARAARRVGDDRRRMAS